MMYQIVVFFPLLGFLYAGLFGRRDEPRFAMWVTTGFLCISCLLSWVVFCQLATSTQTEPLIIPIANWLSVETLQIDWALRIDMLTAVMLVVVTSVSFLVHVYSIGYMAEDGSRPRFFAYLSLFTFAMLMLVTADNLVQMFFGWEGVGLASYLLIGFWYERPSASAAAIKAFVVNRVGDFGFALGIFLVFSLTHSVNLVVIATKVPSLQGHVVPIFGIPVDALTLCCLLLFMGAMGKSAQFLLHTWLPDAMEGPTPVSALIHAATMVTAGVFMVARLSFLFALSPTALHFVTYVGGTTALFAATVGLVQNDIKRVIAYSTCSQLGYMFVAEGVGAYGAGMFHLFTHAFFKALLFLGAGSVIHAMHHEQDMRHMGGLRRDIPFTFFMMLVGTLALTGVGIPFTSLGFAGFVSKDAIIEAAFVGSGSAAHYAFFCVLLAAALTSFYSWRLLFMTFFGHRGGWAGEHVHDHAHGVEACPPTMLLPLAILGIGAIFAGTLFKNWFIGAGFEGFWKLSLLAASEGERVPWFIGLLPFVMMLLGFLGAFYMYVLDKSLPRRLAEAYPRTYRFLLNKWYFDELYDGLFVKPAFFLGRLFWKGGDGAIIDGLGPDNVSARVLAVARGAVRVQTGYIYHYAFVMLIGVSALISFFLFSGWR